jgi:hypothetical protein
MKHKPSSKTHKVVPMIRGAVGSLLLLCSINAFGLEVFLSVDASQPIRTIPMTMFGGNLTVWDSHQDGTNASFNNLLAASGRRYMRWPGGSWGDAVPWWDIEYVLDADPSNNSTWKPSYEETLNQLFPAISLPGDEMAPTLQPIVNFPGIWYGVQHTHEEAVSKAAEWVADQTGRSTTAQYWEIGNETIGPWEPGWFDGISGTYYGDRFADFYLAMKTVNPAIKIGANVEPHHKLNNWGWYDGYWTYDTLVAAKLKGVVPDFLIIHAYPGGGSATDNPELLARHTDEIASFTSSLDGIVSSALGSSYVGQVRYWMTEWDCGASSSYNRRQCYVNAMFHAQYLLEMCKHNWEGANAWAQWEYGPGYVPYPVWYIHPIMINYFGRHMVSASSSQPLVRATQASITPVT